VIEMKFISVAKFKIVWFIEISNFFVPALLVPMNALVNTRFWDIFKYKITNFCPSKLDVNRTVEF